MTFMYPDDILFFAKEVLLTRHWYPKVTHCIDNSQPLTYFVQDINY